MISFSGVWFGMYVIIAELLVHVLFYFLSKTFENLGNKKLDRRGIFKGLLERIFLTVSLIVGIHQALILFGALKIATRIKVEDNKVSNDFFLVGNIVSVLVSISYYLFFNYLFS